MSNLSCNSEGGKGGAVCRPIYPLAGSTPAAAALFSFS